MSFIDSEMVKIFSQSELWNLYCVRGPRPGQMYEFIHRRLSAWEPQLLGHSYQGRAIYGYTLGQGEKKVLMWSQMHGNEPFSSYALLLAMEFLQSGSELARIIRKQVQVTAIPMLNPDGSVAFVRRNAQGIDINRDALRRITPEAKILVQVFEKLQPGFCFNLHDQEVYYAPQGQDRPSAMAFLVPAADNSKRITPSRAQGMDILGFVASQLAGYPLAKYNDSFMPTAFGDYFSSQGAVTMLFETGYLIGDKWRRETTKLHAQAIVLALGRIVETDGKDYSGFYHALPFNQKHAFFDFIMKNVILTDQKHEFTVDLAINRNRLDPDKFVSVDDEYFIFDIGDLTDRKAFVVEDFKRKLVLPKEKIYMYAPANWLLTHFN